MSNPTTPFTDEALAKVVEVLATVGLTPEYGFEFHAQRESSYFCGLFEWTERFKGSRFYITKRTPEERVSHIHVVNYSIGGPYSEVKLAEVNAKLEFIIKNFNQ